MEHRADHLPLGAPLASGGRSLARAQWGMLIGVVALLIVLEAVLLYTYVSIGRAGERYDERGASATMMSNVQREALKLALVTEQGQGFDAVEMQRALLEQPFRIAEIAATNAATRDSLVRVRALLDRFDADLARVQRSGVEPRAGSRRLRGVLRDLEREAKRAFDQSELHFYQSAGPALRTQKRSQIVLLGIGAVLFVLVLPLGLSLHWLFDSRLKRLSAFPRLNPFPVVELAPTEIRFANEAAESLAAEFPAGTIDALLPPDWHTIVEEHLADRETSTITRELELNGRTLSWSFIALGSQGVVHGYGEDVTEQKGAEERVRRQAELNGYQALHDSLTGLGNRRKLMDDGERKLAMATGDAPLVLAIFDLDGFKHYNDTFGHPAGDALLARLGGRLRSALPGEATAYRMGGDEFCVLAELSDVRAVVTMASEALSEDGESFTIRCSAGAATIPAEAASLVQALQIADQRLYAQKRSTRASAGSETRAALVQVLIEQDPHLGSHATNVAQLAAETATALGLADDEVSRVRLAAELHDVGKAAIPRGILEKPGPLDEQEWAFVRRHPIIGERILAAAPALAAVGHIVRASHERIDGDGYPDRLAGDEIPLAARVVAIADAFDAMIETRPYRSALTIPEACAELRRCAGTQFDPRVVEAFVRVVERRERLAEVELLDTRRVPRTRLVQAGPAREAC